MKFFVLYDDGFDVWDLKDGKVSFKIIFVFFEEMVIYFSHGIIKVHKNNVCVIYSIVVCCSLGI